MCEIESERERERERARERANKTIMVLQAKKETGSEKLFYGQTGREREKVKLLFLSSQKVFFKNFFFEPFI